MSMKIGSVQDIIQWAKGKDPNETYLYYNCDTCALARYARDRGVDYHPTRTFGMELEHVAAVRTKSAVKMSEFLEALQSYAKTGVVPPEKPEFETSEAGAIWSVYPTL